MAAASKRRGGVGWGSDPQDRRPVENLGQPLSGTKATECLPIDRGAQHALGVCGGGRVGCRHRDRCERAGGERTDQGGDGAAHAESGDPDLVYPLLAQCDDERSTLRNRGATHHEQVGDGGDRPSPAVERSAPPIERVLEDEGGDIVLGEPAPEPHPCLVAMVVVGGEKDDDTTWSHRGGDELHHRPATLRR